MIKSSLPEAVGIVKNSFQLVSKLNVFNQITL